MLSLQRLFPHVCLSFLSHASVFLASLCTSFPWWLWSNHFFVSLLLLLFGGVHVGGFLTAAFTLEGFARYSLCFLLFLLSKSSPARLTMTVAALSVAVALLTLCSVATQVVAAPRESRSCSLLFSPPSYTFLGGGFHMQLAIDYPAAAQEATFVFELPKSFFIDEAEAEQLYRMEVISSVPDRQGTEAVVMKDVTDAYTSLRMSSQYFFDIEAPVFKVNYTTNRVELSFQQLPETTALDAYLGTRASFKEKGSIDAIAVPVKARLVIPIHSRYDNLDITTRFSLKNFVLGESAYVHRCLLKMSVSGVADMRCGSKAFTSSATQPSLTADSQYQTCLELPVGLLDDLPYVYRALMGLLVAGAVIVILAIR